MFVAKRFSTYGRGTSDRAIGLPNFEGRTRDDFRYCPGIGRSLFQMSAKSFHWSFSRFHTTMNLPVSALPSLKVILYVPISNARSPADSTSVVLSEIFAPVLISPCQRSC